MTKTQTFCDFCGKEITSSCWDEQPCEIHLKLGEPAQAYESRKAEHVCRRCRLRLVSLWDSMIAKPEADPA